MNLVSPPTDDGDVASKGAVGVSETLVAPEAPDWKPVQGGGVKPWGHAGNGGRQRVCGQGNRGRRGLAGAEWSWGRAKTHLCINIWSLSGMNFLFVGDLMELTLGGVPTYGCSMSGDLWRDTKML